MNIPCDYPPQTCSDGALANLSMEDPDVRLYLATAYHEDCTGQAFSAVSWLDAYLHALQVATAYCSGGTYLNESQTCISLCADGVTSFSFTIPEGSVYGETQLDANRLAYQIACEQARLNRVCLSSFPDECCVNAAFSDTVDASPSATYGWSVSSGALPTGLVLTENGGSAIISGTPTVAGSFTFTLRCTTGLASYAERSYTIQVIGIANASLPAGNVGDAYSQVVTESSGVAGTFSAVGLPPGLTISAAGLISGTPTAGGAYSVVITFTPS